MKYKSQVSALWAVYDSEVATGEGVFLCGPGQDQGAKRGAWWGMMLGRVNLPSPCRPQFQAREWETVVDLLAVPWILSSLSLRSPEQ